MALVPIKGSDETTVKHLDSRLLQFGDIGGYGKERENISPLILYIELNQCSFQRLITW